jgi:hypothetical protein
MEAETSSRPGSPTPALIAVVLLTTAWGCSSPVGPASPPDPLPLLGSVLVGAGDIALCGSPGPEATARLLDGIGGLVFTTGDNAYPRGSAVDYAECYAPTWGRHRERTFPAPGNHEYETPGAAGYFDYFESQAGPRGLGYYAVSLGPWRVISLNSEVGVRTGSTSTRAPCTLAIWHRPLFSSGPSRDNPDMRDFFSLLHEFNAEIILNGHDHLYERFAPQDADGRPDVARGVRQFIVGTGGAPLYDPGPRRANSEAIHKVWGVLKLSLLERSYSWEFLAVGGGVRDSGIGTCH